MVLESTAWIYLLLDLKQLNPSFCVGQSRVELCFGKVLSFLASVQQLYCFLTQLDCFVLTLVNMQ